MEKTFLCLFLGFLNGLFKLVEFFDLCSLKNNDHNKKNNIKSQIKKNIITGYNKDNTPIEEEILVNQYCNLEDEMCLVDPQGNNTCCDGLKCIRKSDNYQYKVCSKKNEEDYSCGHNKFAVNTEKQSSEEFTEEQSSEELTAINDYYNKMKSNIKKKINGLCGSQNLSEKEKNNMIQINLNNMFNEGLVFAQPVPSIKFD